MLHEYNGYYDYKVVKVYAENQAEALKLAIAAINPPKRKAYMVGVALTRWNVELTSDEEKKSSESSTTFGKAARRAARGARFSGQPAQPS